MTSKQVAADFAALAEHLPRYQPRPGQLEMAGAVGAAIDSEDMLAVEAGTGVGKTLGYLLPLLRRDGRSLVCTGTRHLQDQLYDKDLPLALKALGQSRSVCLLKGRANYLCRYRYEINIVDGLGLKTQDDEELERLRAWAGKTVSGDLAELRLEENHKLIPQITSTTDNCLGKKCPEYDNCHVVRVREQALQADLVITNHHLLASDLVLREEEFGRLLPGFDVHVIDEAHRLAGVLEDAFEKRWSSGNTFRLADALRKHATRTGGDVAALTRLATQIRDACRDLHSNLLEHCGKKLGEQTGAPENFEVWATPVLAALAQVPEVLPEESDEDPERATFRARAARQHEDLAAWPGDDPDWVSYMVVARESFRLHRVPLDISSQFADSRRHYGPCWVFTSATLGPADTDGGTDFDYLRRQLGLGAELITLDLPSPYDYPQQARLYLPPNLPEPSDPEYLEAIVDAVLPLIETLGGRTLLLFTSLRAMRAARELLADRQDFHVCMQGEEPKARLLERLATEPDTVLLGSISFWEGVDVPGAALQLVVIDRIPFASHLEPVMQARLERIRAEGGNPFMQMQLPRAALLLKQGAGRLIRSESDTGVVVVADPRVRTKRYGPLLLAGLPPMRHEDDGAQVAAFLSA